MKKNIARFLMVVILTLVSFPSAHAASAPETADPTPALSLADVKLNEVYEIPDYAEVTFTDFQFADKRGFYNEFGGGTEKSGSEEDFALLYVSILNIKQGEIDYKKTEIHDVTFTYDGKYTFEGFVRQCDHDRNEPDFTLEKESYEFPINQLYVGYYVIGASLPNAVVGGDKPLEVTFQLSNYTFSYFIRK